MKVTNYQIPKKVNFTGTNPGRNFRRAANNTIKFFKDNKDKEISYVYAHRVDKNPTIQDMLLGTIERFSAIKDPIPEDKKLIRKLNEMAYLYEEGGDRFANQFMI